MTPSQSALSALPDSGKELYSKAADYLLEIDGQIARLDKVLARLQPPVSGRVRISWRDEGSSATAKCKPVLVRWVRVGDKWRTTRLGLKSLVQKTPKSGAFYDTKDEVPIPLVMIKQSSDVITLIKGHDQRLQMLRLSLLSSWLSGLIPDVRCGEAAKGVARCGVTTSQNPLTYLAL